HGHTGSSPPGRGCGGGGARVDDGDAPLRAADGRGVQGGLHRLPAHRCRQLQRGRRSRWGQPCNYTTDVGGPVTLLCSAPLVCSLRFNGTCLRAQECL
ncbi:Protein of unknown function, partial [Gryllus bimaculatus]